MKKVVTGLLLLAGLAIRIPGLFDPPLDFHPTRQYRSAIMARGYSLDRLTVGPAERDAARRAADQQQIIEPPVIEHAAAFVYHLVGHEDLRLARLISVLGWIGGALALWWLAAQLWTRPTAHLAGLAVFLLLPFGIPASQAFQPDPLMVALVVAAVTSAMYHDVRPRSTRRLLLALAAGAAIFIKPMAAFFIFPVVLVLAIRRAGWVRGGMAAGGLALIAAAPTVAWYVFVAPGAVEERMFPQLLRTRAFWLDWLHMIDVVVWWPLVVASVVGVASSRGRTRAMLLALWSGYIALGLVFTHHIHTHNYYSLPLIPIVALSVAAMVNALDGAIAAPVARRAAGWAALALVVVGLTASVRTAGVLRSSSDLHTAVADYERIGSIVGHTARVATLDGNYGAPLNYHGYLLVSNWPLSGDRALARLAGRALPTGEEQLASLDADFFVATIQSELDGEPNLHRLLEARYPLVDRGGPPDHWRYLVFDLRHPKFSVNPEKLSLFALNDGRSSSPAHVTLWTPASAGWQVSVPTPEPVAVQPDHGIGPATLQFVAQPAAGELDRTVEVAIHAVDSTTPSATVTVRLRALATRPDSLPFGSVDGPADPVIFSGSPVTFQGWALDALDLRRVRVEYADAAGHVRTIGETHGTWKRPDVAAAYPNAHDIFNSGWAFTLEPKMLEQAALPLTLRFYGEAGDGRRGEIGKRTVRGK